MKTTTNIKTLVALLLAIVMAIGLVGCSAGGMTGGTGDADPAVIVDTDGTVIEIPNPDAKTSNGNNSDSQTQPKDETDKNGTKTATTMTGKACKAMKEKNVKAYGDIVTVVRSVSKPTEPDTKNTSMSNGYGVVNWSTSAQGYVTFTAKGQERCFILEGPDGRKAIFTVQKGETIKASLIDGTGKYQYAIGNNTADGKAHTVQYKNSFSVSKVDSDLAPYLVSNPYGDYENAPVAVAKADELWDTSKNQDNNVEAIAKYVRDLKYDKKLKTGTLDAYVNPDKVIEKGGGVCGDMSKLLVAMLRSQGIPAYHQNGTNEDGKPHGWVMAWLEISVETKGDVTYSTGTWVLIEATGGDLLPKDIADRDYTPSAYAN